MKKFWTMLLLVLFITIASTANAEKRFKVIHVDCNYETREAITGKKGSVPICAGDNNIQTVIENILNEKEKTTGRIRTYQVIPISAGGFNSTSSPTVGFLIVIEFN